MLSCSFKLFISAKIVFLQFFVLIRIKFQKKTKTLPRNPTRNRQRREAAAPTSTSGSSWRSCSRPPSYTARVSGGWIAPRAYSKSKTLSKWPVCGAKGRTGRPWTTTSSADRYGSTTRRVLWKRPNDRKDWSINSVIRTTFKLVRMYIRGWLGLRCRLIGASPWSYQGGQLS